MIVCRKCSRRYADGTTFCTCGAFLEFDGEHVADATAPTDPVTAEYSTGAPPPTPTNAPTTSSAPNPPPPGPSPQTEPAPWSGFSSDSPTQPATGGVDARLPDAPAGLPPTEPVRVESGARPSDLICRQCGTPNPPEREFCRHCGQPLALVPVTASGSTGERPLPWWRRLSKRARQKARSADPSSAAATAHRLSQGGMSGRPLLFRSAGITVVLMGMLAFLGPWRGTVIAKAKDFVGASRYQVLDDNVSVETTPASSAVTPIEFELQPAELAVDEFENTAWATQWIEPDRLGVSTLPDDGECVSDVGTDSVLRFTFEDETDISRIRILGGRFAADDARTSFSRPRIIELQTDDTCEHLELADDGTLTNYDFDHDNVTEVELRVLSRWADVEESAPTVEISAVVFERKR